LVPLDINIRAFGAWSDPLGKRSARCFFCFCFLISIPIAFANDIRFLEQMDALRFQKGVAAPFLGIFTHVEVKTTLEEKIALASRIISENQYISGITLKICWSDLHPSKSVIRIDLLEKLIATIASHGKLINLGIIPGFRSPEWIYDEGVRKAGPFTFGSTGPFSVGPVQVFAPLPWDEKYMALLSADIKAIAARYGTDPRLFSIEVLGHNYKGEEMHAPDPASLSGTGWTPEKALDNWKYWIDLYNSLFPNKKLILVISQMYLGEKELPAEVAEYFVARCQGRAILQTDQLNGREDKLLRSMEICRSFSSLAPNCHEMVGSFKTQPARQGEPGMTINNFLKGGNPLYLQLWRGDADDPRYAKALLDAWGEYHKQPSPVQ
jgi:hypothetical protein